MVMTDDSAVGRLSNPLQLTSTAEVTVLQQGSDLASLMLEGVGRRAELSQLVLSADVEFTMDGASTLTVQVRDKGLALLNSGVLTSNVTVVVDGVKFRLVSVDKSGWDLTLGFEDEVVARLRLMKKPRKAVRGTVNRAQFIRQLVRELNSPTVGFICPEINQVQQIGPAKVKLGFAPGTKLKIKGQTSSAVQLRNIDEIMKVGLAMGVNKRLLICALMGAFQESGAHVLSGSKAGVFGRKPGAAGWGTSAQLKDTKRSARIFFQKAMRIYKGKPSIEYAELVSKVLLANKKLYAKRRDEAEKAVSEYGVTGSGTSVASNTKAPYIFSRGEPAGSKGEDSWVAIKRLADEVKWRAWAYRNSLYFISDDYLIKSSPRMVLSEDSPGVTTVNFKYDIGQKISEATVACRIGRWTAPPGSVVELKELGVANGRWLTSSISRSLFSADATITLRAKDPKLPEPPADQVEQNDSGAGSSTGTDGVPLAIQRAYAKAKSIDKQGYRYTYGGGHGSFAGPYDCSGAVSAVLHAAGKISRPMDTVALGKFGKSGKGRYMTVYVRPFAGKNGHTYIVFNIPGKGEERFEAHGPAGVGPGGRFVSRRTDSGYNARHIEGA